MQGEDQHICTDQKKKKKDKRNKQTLRHLLHLYFNRFSAGVNLRLICSGMNPCQTCLFPPSPCQVTMIGLEIIPPMMGLFQNQDVSWKMGNNGQKISYNGYHQDSLIGYYHVARFSLTRVSRTALQTSVGDGLIPVPSVCTDTDLF